MISLKNKVALVTGSSRGIGAAIAQRFATLGASVVLTGRDENALKQMVEKLESEKKPAEKASYIFYPADVSNEQDVQNLVAWSLEKMGKIDILVNNAGITRDGLILRMKTADWDDVFSVNLRSAFFLSRAVVRHMMKARYGRIVNISSVVGQVGNAGQVNYAASKGGMIAFTKSLAREVASRKITVNAIAPGFIDTNMTEKLTDEAKKYVLENIPLGYQGHVDDISAGVAFLASDEAGYITGATLPINGGMAML